MYKKEKDTRICCNQCGRELKMEQGIVKEGCVPWRLTGDIFLPEMVKVIVFTCAKHAIII